MLRSLLVVVFVLSVVLTACAPATPITPVPYPAPTQDVPVSGGDTGSYPPPTTGIVVESPVSPYPDGSAGGTVAMPYLPQPGDEKMTRGEAYLDAATLLSAESYPPQITLQLVGNLPNPCHQLRVNIARPDAQNRIQIEVYSVAGTDLACIEVLQPFDAAVPLGSFPAGKYTVFVNGEQIGEFEN
ncbi:MAG: hypothetical protein OHK0052_21810 [Anaerolineales bacterium]